jgi:hypothetical protein
LREVEAGILDRLVEGRGSDLAAGHVLRVSRGIKASRAADIGARRRWIGMEKDLEEREVGRDMMMAM